MRLDEAIKWLGPLHKRLERADTDRKRRTARRAFIGGLRSVRIALDKAYPKPQRPKPQREPKPAKIPKPKPYRTGAAFDPETARLYMRVVCDGRANPKLTAHAGARPGKDVHHSVVYFDPAWPSYRKWQQILLWMRDEAKIEDAPSLLKKFFHEPIPTADLAAGADHHRFLEAAAKRRERALRLRETRQRKGVLR